MKFKRVEPTAFHCDACGQYRHRRCHKFSGGISKKPHKNRIDKATGANMVLENIESDMNKAYLIQEEPNE